ncbi:unnamed protein product [Clonostachys rhizophaga]|uniref:GH16 domain-containing protein n=1 Tax=Clonostachys rhizophaga TaxID=160324 RepID=A0A9N9YWH1_9HYPO|nr:unnamed protein product [Clonostachys rhizophaga]
MYFSKSALIAAMAGLSAARSVPTCSKRSAEPTFDNGVYVVSDTAQFSNHKQFTFEGSSLPDGLYAADWGIDENWSVNRENVAVKDGYLVLTVPGGQSKPYKSAEVDTTVGNILYGSVRTVAIFSQTPGVCNGIFFYKSDSQETDIEWLSDPNNTSDNGVNHLWLTNQENDGDGQKTVFSVAPPSNPTTTEHEYRIDWTQGRVQWFVDGVQVAETTKDVPSVPGPWVWNNWSNGDKGWSAGPPTADAVFKIKSIDMYYNTA